MGVSTDAYFGFGVTVEEDSGEEDSDFKIIDKIFLEDDCHGIIRIVQHCSCDYLMYAILIDKTITVAHRGYPREIRITSIGEITPTPPEIYTVELRKFLRKNKLSESLVNQKPRYLLFSHQS